MVIKKDLSNLPDRAHSEGGWPPDEDDSWGRNIVEAWLDKRDPDVELELAIPEAGPMRASFAAMCSRAISYDVGPDLPKPPTKLKDRWRFILGTLVHKELQASFADGETVKAEVKVDLNPIGVPGSAHSDLVVYDKNGDPLFVVEIKTVNGTGFKQMATNDRGPATGPRLSYQLQGGMIAKALGAPEVRIMLFAMENVADWHLDRYGTPRLNDDAKSFYAQWTIPTEELLPIVDREAKRLAKIAELSETGGLAPRALVDEEIPAQARVVDPMTGDWELADDKGNVVAAGRAWQCRYCRWQTFCAEDTR